LQTVSIGHKRIGPHEPVFIIAEAGVNHNGDVGLARQLVDVAAEAGADAVKFQTFKAEQVASPSAPKADYQLGATGAGESQQEMLRSLELSPKDHYVLRDHCQRKGLIFLSTPFAEQSADFLDELGVPAFKIPSGEITNFPFLQHVARKGKPLIVSTGMSWLSEVDEAVRTIRSAGTDKLILLHCVSRYPADPAEANLKAIRTMEAVFQVPVGFSDHTLGTEVALAAAAIGARVLEKHFTLDRTLPGPDHRASLEPQELKALIAGVRKVEQALGHGRKEPSAAELETAAVVRRSLVAACEIEPDTVLTESMVGIKRPGTGISPSMLPFVIGRKVKTRLVAGALITPEALL